MFRERFGGRRLTKPKLINGIVSMLQRMGIRARKGWFASLDPRTQLFGMYAGLTHGGISKALGDVLRSQGAISNEPHELRRDRIYPDATSWTFNRSAGASARPEQVLACTLREAANSCALQLGLYPNSFEQAFTMLEEAGIRIPDYPDGRSVPFPGRGSEAGH